MGYTTLIDSNLKVAFRLLKDLAKDAVFNPKTSTGFDFTKSEPTGVIGTPIPAKVILVESKKDPKSNRVARQLMFRSKDVPNVDSFLTVTVGAVTYKIGNLIKSDGYIQLLELRGESDG